MSKGRVYLELTEALISIMKRNNLTAYKIHQELIRNPEAYDTPESFSLTCVNNAIANKPISRRSMEVLRSFVRCHDPDLMPAPLRDVDLDFARFLHVRDEDIAMYGRALEGDFQTHARSTTAEGYVRMGHIAFQHDALRRRIRASETQHRPAIDGHHATTMNWSGFVAPKSEYIYAILHTLQDAKDATPLWYQFRPLLRDHASGRIITLKAKAMHYEAERGSTMYPEVFLVRTDLHDIKLDFVPMHAVTSAAVRMELALGPRLATNRRRPTDPQ